MKVLLLCMAFAAVSLAKPVADNIPEGPAVSLPDATEKNVEAQPAEQLAPVASASEKSPTVTVTETKSASVDPVATKLDEALEVKSKNKEPKVDETEKEKASNPTKIISGVLKSDVDQATVKEVPNIVSTKSAVPSDAVVADEVSAPAAEINTEKSEPSVEDQKNKLSNEPAPVEEQKPSESNAENVSVSAPPVDAKEAESLREQDMLRVERDTVDDKFKANISSVEAHKEAELLKEASADTPNHESKETPNEVSAEALNIVSEKKELDDIKKEPSEEAQQVAKLETPIKDDESPKQVRESNKSKESSKPLEEPKNPVSLETGEPQESNMKPVETPLGAAPTENSSEESNEKIVDSSSESNESHEISKS